MNSLVESQHALERFYERCPIDEIPEGDRQFFEEAYRCGKRVDQIMDLRAKNYWRNKEREQKDKGWYFMTFYKGFVIVFEISTNPVTVVTCYRNNKTQNMHFIGDKLKMAGIKIAEMVK